METNNWPNWLDEVEHLFALEGLDARHDVGMRALRQSFNDGLSPQQVVEEKLIDDRASMTDFTNDVRRDGNFEECSVFDKFVDQILIKEGHNRVKQHEYDSPQRKRAARHQDRPLNKIRFGSK